MTDTTLSTGAEGLFPFHMNGTEALPPQRRRSRPGERQIDIILAHLQSGKSLSNEEAEELCQCSHLSSKVSDLKALGHDIVKTANIAATTKFFLEMDPDPGGTR